MTRFGLMAAIVLGVASFTQSARADPPVSPGTNANSQNASSDAPRDAGIPTSEEHELPQVTVEARRQRNTAACPCLAQHENCYTLGGSDRREWCLRECFC
jgi:hypothetical protein